MPTSNRKVLSVSYKGDEYPVVEILEYPHQVLIRFIHSTAHWTLHPIEVNEAPFAVDPLLLTSYDEKKPRSTWDSWRIRTARSHGLANPNKHANYLVQTYLRPFDEIAGYELGARLLSLTKQPGDKKYLSASVESIGKATSEQPMLYITLSTLNNPYQSGDLSVETFLGSLHFRLKKV